MTFDLLQATRVYSTSFYGSMLYNLYAEQSNMIYRCWKTAAKLARDVPRSTFSFLVDRVLTIDMPSVRDGILTRYAMYQQRLYMNNSREIRILASTASSDGREWAGCEEQQQADNQEGSLSEYSFRKSGGFHYLPGC